MGTLIKKASRKESKFPYFPYILQSETPYSLLSRYVTLTKESSRYLSYLLFNSERVISHSLNGKIAQFCERAGLKEDPYKILFDHTILPLYLLNYNLTEHKRILNEMLNGDAQKILNEIGYRKGQIKVCPECMIEDLATYGMPYLRREHQISGIYFCYDHKTRLKELITGNESYANLYKCKTRDLEVEGDDAIHLRLAWIAHELLGYQIDKDQIDTAIKHQLITHGYKIGPSRDITKTSKLQNDFLNYFGKGLLNQIGLGCFEIKLNWLERLITRGKNINVQPIAYIVFISFFSDSVDDFIEVQVNEAEQVKSRKPKPEEFKLKKRQVLDELITQGLSRTDLFRNHEALYRHFIRYDRSYMDEIAPIKDRKGQGSIDWERKDLLYEELCFLLYMFFRSRDGYPQITKPYCAKILRCDSIIHYKDRFPRTHAFLDSIIETPDKARIRKTCDLADKLVEEGKYCWENITLAKIYNSTRQVTYTNLKKVETEIENYILLRQMLEQLDIKYQIE